MAGPAERSPSARHTSTVLGSRVLRPLLIEQQHDHGRPVVVSDKWKLPEGKLELLMACTLTPNRIVLYDELSTVVRRPKSLWKVGRAAWETDVLHRLFHETLPRLLLAVL